MGLDALVVVAWTPLGCAPARACVRVRRRYAFFIFDCVYVKHTVDTVKMTNWGRVYYTNFLTLPALLFMMLALGESDRLGRVTWHAAVRCGVGLGCWTALCIPVQRAARFALRGCAATWCCGVAAAGVGHMLCARSPSSR